ncbi:MAG: hypothetical protein ACYDHX_07880 [Methanothrix sp.]
MSGIINPLELTPSQIKQAMGQLPESMQGKISGVAKRPAPARDDQSPEAIRIANLKTLKAKRRDVIASLIEIEKEIYLTEEITLAEAYNPEVRRETIVAALKATRDTLARPNFSLSEVRELYPYPEITFSSWVTVLTALHREGAVLFYDDNITILKTTRKGEH